MFKLIFQMTVQGFFLVLSQVFLKLGMNDAGELHLDWPSFFSVIKNYFFWLAGLTMMAAGMIWLHVLRGNTFSVAYPLVSISYVFSLIAAIYIFRETVPLIRWIGVIVVMLGVFLVTYGHE
jgi:undecaprenyl phosphate-alpha-L-ara4N flippase subunit ArnE